MRLLLGISIIITISSCKNQSTTQINNQTGDSGIYYPYTPTYTNGYTPGKNKNLQMVTEFWKEFENGDVKNNSDFFAEDIKLVFPDKVVKGKRDSVLNVVKSMRESYKSLQSLIYSWLPAKANELGDEWVFIWGKYEVTDPNGKFRIIKIHEMWRFDKEGKIDFMQQYHTRNS